MNLRPSIFTIISAISCISFVGDAIADTCNAAGWYRWEKSSTAKDWCMPCPEGCYCPNNAEKTKIITGGAQWRSCTSGLEQYGIYDCGDGWTSAKINTSCMLPGNGKQTYCQGAMTFSQCFFTSKEGTKVYGNGTSIKCSPGTYTKAGYAKCQTCKTGYICPGKMAYNDQMKMNPVKPSSEWKSGWKYWEEKLRLSPRTDSGIYLCPSGKVANSSHTACETGSTYCKAGQYLPANASTCKECKDRYYCLGGSFKPASFDQGLKTCPAGKVPDAYKKSCIKDTSNSSANKTVSCDSGYYLPKNVSSCSVCKNRYYLCAGGSFKPASFDQGIVKCSSGYVADYATKQCVSEKINNPYVAPTKKPVTVDGEFNCEPGTYLPAKGSKCITCPTTKNYCPGGTFKQADYDQGVKICPDKTLANSNKSACTVSLTKDQMRYGMANNASSATDEQCWTRNTMDDYMRCMFGGKMVVTYTPGNIIKIDENEE